MATTKQRGSSIHPAKHHSSITLSYESSYSVLWRTIKTMTWRCLALTCRRFCQWPQTLDKSSLGNQRQKTLPSNCSLSTESSTPKTPLSRYTRYIATFMLLKLAFSVYLAIMCTMCSWIISQLENMAIRLPENLETFCHETTRGPRLETYPFFPYHTHTHTSYICRTSASR